MDVIHHDDQTIAEEGLDIDDSMSDDDDEYRNSTFIEYYLEYIFAFWYHIKLKYFYSDENWYTDLKGRARWCTDEATFKISVSIADLILFCR